MQSAEANKMLPLPTQLTWYLVSVAGLLYDTGVTPRGRPGLLVSPASVGAHAGHGLATLVPGL